MRVQICCCLIYDFYKPSYDSLIFTKIPTMMANIPFDTLLRYKRRNSYQF